MTDLLAEALNELTKEQRAAVTHPGDFLLVARPGSGKTRTVGLRLAYATRQGGRRIAVASYTNVAVDEVKTVCSEVGVVVGSEHYAGTLHSFLIDYVVRPFGHLVTSGKAPHIRSLDWGLAKDGQPATGWLSVKVGTNLFVPAWHFEHTSEGAVICRALPPSMRVFITPEKATAAGAEQAAKAKKRQFACGVLSQSDAVYVAYRVLSDYPRLRAAVAGRFTEIVVDEAQDTSELQVACLRLLHETGLLNSLVLVADPEQSIYGFQGADPERLRAFADDRNLTPPLELTVNFRSSQRICDVAHRFTAREHPDVARGPNADVELPPEVFIYDGERPADAVGRFRDRLQDHQLQSDDAVVLARSTALCDKIAERPDAGLTLSRALGAFATLAALRDGSQTLSPSVIGRAEEVVLWMISDKLSMRSLSDDRRRRLRECVNSIRVRLPLASLPFEEWIPQARDVVQAGIDGLLTSSVELQRPPGAVMRYSAKLSGLCAADLIPKVALDLAPQTVHSVKGRSIDAVLFVVEVEGGHGDQARLLSALHSEEDVPEEHRELLRIGFVAVSRAERYCAVALPHTVAEDVVARYISMGFERV